MSTLKYVLVPLPIAFKPVEIFHAEPEGSWFNDLPILVTLIAAVDSTTIPASKLTMSNAQQMETKRFMVATLSVEKDLTNLLSAGPSVTMNGGISCPCSVAADVGEQSDRTRFLQY